VDRDECPWIIKYDGSAWTVYNSTNSGLVDNIIWAVKVDSSGNLWIGTDGHSLIKFDGSTWTTYSTSNSGLPSNAVYSMAIDKQGNKWFGTYSGLAKLTG